LVVSTSGVASRVLDESEPFAVLVLSVIAAAAGPDLFSVSVAAVVLSPVFCCADTVEVGPVEDDVDDDVDSDDVVSEPDVPVVVVVVVAPVPVVVVAAELSALVDWVESVVSAVATPWPAVTAAPRPTVNAPTRSHCAQAPDESRRCRPANVLPLRVPRCERKITRS
jgi:hypothetical protein